VRRRQEAQEREDQGHHGHAQDLDARAHRNGEQLGVLRLAEHVAVHELPAGLFCGLLGRGQLIVLGDVAVQRPQEDHGHHARQEEHDHQGV